jgi:hypothetical protein
VRFADVDGEERDAIAIPLGQALERPNLGAERRSGVGAEHERDGPLAQQLAQLHRSPAVDPRELEIGGDVAFRDLRTRELAVLGAREDTAA